MTPAQHAPGQHFSSCSGPDNCAEYLSIMSMTPAEQCAWIHADQQRIAGLRSASARTHQFRVSQPENYSPPPAYGPDLERIRADVATPMTRWEEQHAAERTREFEAEYARADAERATPRPAPLADTNDYSPPSAYAEGISRLQKEMK